MNSTLSSGFQLKHGSVARALSLLLLTFIFYATTVEAAHRHGRVVTSNAASAFSSGEPNNDQISQLAGCSDCLICQLHQDFSATFLTTRASGAPQVQSVSLAGTDAVVLQSHYSTPQRGRAPPVTTS